MIKMSRKAKKAMAVALTAGMLASTAVTPVMAATQGWKQNAIGWWYQNADGTWPANKWEKINGAWYYFDANGYMKANSWVKDSKGIWYYVGSNGAMKTNAWAQDKAGLWYYVTEDGSMYGGGWKLINGKWYFFKNDGSMQSGVVNVAGKTYYMGASNDGAMKTGKVSIETVEYNFNEDGACTDAKVPETTKVFDKKGNPVTPEVEIEKVNGINGAITNAISEYSEYGNVIIAGNDAYFKVLVTQNGEPVVGTPVALTSKCVAGREDDYGIKSLSVQNTDKDGYATFVIGAEDSDVTATSARAALYELTANAVSINEVFKADLAFARVNMGEVKESTHNDDDWSKSHTAIYPSANIGELTGENKIAWTCGIDGNNQVEYIPSQQVSTGTSADHAVTFEINPELVIPTKDAEKVDSYSQEINKSISEYSVYQDGSTTSFKVTDVPAGLRYATLNFENIDISEYTRVEIRAYEKGTTDEVPGSFKKIEGGITQKTFGYQIPVQDDTAIDIEVKVISEGQVNDSQNGGLTIKDIKGVYKTAPTTDVEIPLNDCITWSETEIQYSEEKKMTPTEALSYGITAHYNRDYKYSYVVPVFPYVGNAIITVKDENKDIVAYYTLPTVNQNENGWLNENDIVDYGSAILVTEDEAFNKVGTVTANGNKVTVNSSATGYTALQAKIELKGFDEEINLLNDTSYTSVHWAPLPDEVQAADDFYALKGQYVTVTAQLLDRNGNKSSKKDVTINFSYVGEDTTDSNKEKTYNVEDGALKGVNASATNVNALTDKNGQVTIKIASDDADALVKELKANSTEGEVVLAIGDKNVEVANLHWVDAGLAFTSNVDAAEDEQYILSTLAEFAGKATDGADNDDVKKQLEKEPGSSWIFGYEVVGETRDIDDTEIWVDSIEGLKVALSKDGSADMSTDGLANGVAKLTSTKSGGTKLTGKLDDSSITDGTDVVFNVATKTGDTTTYKKYTNVGEGKASLAATLDLPVSFGQVGLEISEKSIVAKSGNSEYSIAKSVITERAPELYIVATDAYGNKQAEKKVECTISYYGEDNKLVGEKVVMTGTTDSNGLLGLDLASTVSVDNSAKTVTRAEISATIDNESLARVITVKYVDDTNITKFAMPSAKYVAPAAGSTDGQIELAFTQDVDKTTVDAIAAKDLFEVTYTKDNKTYVANVKSAKVDGKKVILTLDNKTFADADKFTVTVNSKEQDGITYKLRDKYGRTLEANTVTSTVGTFKFSAEWDDVNSQIKLTGVGASDKVIAVYDMASGLELGNGNDAGTGYETLTGAATIGPNMQANKEVSVTLYYVGTGMSATVTIPESTITGGGIYAPSVAGSGATTATPAKITVTYSRKISKVENIVVKGDDGNAVTGVTVVPTIDTTDKTKVTYTLTFAATGTTDLNAGTYTITADVTGAESGNKAQTVVSTQVTVTQ